MGIDNREYMYDADPRGGATRGFQLGAVPLLIGINIVVWVMWLLARTNPGTLGAFMNDNFLCSVGRVFSQLKIHTLVTSAFSHIDPQHILFNMIFFYVLGVDVEVFYGKLNLIALYVFAGVAAALAQCGLNVVQGADVPMLGASGSVMGIAAAAAFIDPNKPMLMMGFLPMKLWQLVLLYIVMDLTGALTGGGRIAHAAHLGGAFAGMLFYVLDLRVFASRGRQNSGLIARFSQWRKRGKFRSIEGNVERPFTTNTYREELKASWDRPKVDPDASRKVDALLAKISREGMGALTDDERNFLQTMSEKYRKP